MLFQALTGILALFLKVDEAVCYPPPLSPEEERDCFARCRAGDAQAREKLILHNLRLVAHIVKKYYINGKNQEDLISIGTIGLIKAVDSFDPSNGARFVTYAGRCLQNEILMHFRAQKKTQCEVSLSEPIDMDKDGNPLTYMDIICEDDTIAEDIFVKITSARAKRFIREGLTPRERQILILRYGLAGDAPLTQREIAEGQGISRSYVSRIEKAALQKIKAHLSAAPGLSG